MQTPDEKSFLFLYTEMRDEKMKKTTKNSSLYFSDDYVRRCHLYDPDRTDWRRRKKIKIDITEVKKAGKNELHIKHTGHMRCKQSKPPTKKKKIIPELLFFVPIMRHPTHPPHPIHTHIPPPFPQLHIIYFPPSFSQHRAHLFFIFHVRI